MSDETTDTGSGDEKHAETAPEKVLREIEKIERRTRDTDEQKRHRGEAGEAITPNTEAQEESQGD
ncbi:hypothetical protein [Streptomyces sp. B93]|uniref:hypothetical protein n=1 Tax=Streptomyces sp. B93 TaxID=2824875 RepID=UPI001B369086|nr:hypothetical protein [Streptomyces sp. B93]MBQ1088371.1 hypothetical protein [Streptomyces sp. B93]